jgi:hypothetical protein
MGRCSRTSPAVLVLFFGVALMPGYMASERLMMACA